MIDQGIFTHGDTNRGFEIVTFDDRAGLACSLQESSAIGDQEGAYENPGSSFVWLGPGDNRMHLDRQMVAGLIARLRSWLNEGTFGGTP